MGGSAGISSSRSDGSRSGAAHPKTSFSSSSSVRNRYRSASTPSSSSLFASLPSSLSSRRSRCGSSSSGRSPRDRSQSSLTPAKRHGLHERHTEEDSLPSAFSVPSPSSSSDSSNNGDIQSPANGRSSYSRSAHRACQEGTSSQSSERTSRCSVLVTPQDEFVSITRDRTRKYSTACPKESARLVTSSSSAERDVSTPHETTHPYTGECLPESKKAYAAMHLDHSLLRERERLWWDEDEERWVTYEWHPTVPNLEWSGRYFYALNGSDSDDEDDDSDEKEPRSEAKREGDDSGGAPGALKCLCKIPVRYYTPTRKDYGPCDCQAPTFR